MSRDRAETTAGTTGKSAILSTSGGQSESQQTEQTRIVSWHYRCSVGSRRLILRRFPTANPLALISTLPGGPVPFPGGPLFGGFWDFCSQSLLRVMFEALGVWLWRRAEIASRRLVNENVRRVDLRKVIDPFNIVCVHIYAAM